jgi:hypothetical protein
MSGWPPSDRDRERTVATLLLLAADFEVPPFLSVFFPPPPDAFAVAFFAIG